MSAPVRNLIDRMEADEKKMAEALASDSDRLLEALGPRKFGEHERPELLRLMKFGPRWFVRGNAEPDVANDYWDEKLGLKPDLDTADASPDTGDLDPATAIVDPDAGPASAEAFSKDMYKLAEKYPLELAQLLMEDTALLEIYQTLCQVGLHFGRIKPPLEAYMVDFPDDFRLPLAATPEDQQAMPHPAGAPTGAMAPPAAPAVGMGGGGVPTAMPVPTAPAPPMPVMGGMPNG